MHKISQGFKKLSLSFLLLSTGWAVHSQTFVHNLAGAPLDVTGWNLGGMAAVAGPELTLSPDMANVGGYIYHTTSHTLSTDCTEFTAEFEFKMDATSPFPTHSSGLAFWFLSTPPTIGHPGSSLGLPASLNGFVLAMDVEDNDANGDNPLITLDTYAGGGYTEGSFVNTVGTPLVNQNLLNNNTWRHARIIYSEGTISVYLDLNPVPVIVGDINLDGMVGHFGFSASSSSFYQSHSLRNVMISGHTAYEAPDAGDTTVLCQADASYTVVVPDPAPGMQINWYTDLVSTTELPAAPVVDLNIPGTYTYFISQSSTGDCTIESPRSEVVVVVNDNPIVAIEPSSNLVCIGGEVILYGTITTADPSHEVTHQWLPVGSVSDPTSLTTTANPMISTTYSLIATNTLTGCKDTTSVLISTMPNNITLVNENDTVCAGTVVPLNVSGHPSLHYYWSPEGSGIDNPNAQNTFMVAETPGMVYITASHPGCTDVTDSFYLKVEPNPILSLGEDVKLCMSDTAHLFATVDPADFDEYTYNWSPGRKLSDSTIKNPIFQGYSDEEYIVTVTTPNGCTAVDTIEVFVNASNFLVLPFSDTMVCYSDSIQLEAAGAVHYKWSPSTGLSNDTISNPVAYLGSSMEYTLEGTNEHGCVDVKTVTLNMLPAPITTLPDTVYLFPGESYEMDLQTNGHYFSWFPPEGLNNPTIANPVATPEIRTRYFVNVMTEHGCSTTDSIDIVYHLESIFDVPNAFVPGNMNANNGEFKISTRGQVELINFQIFDRWGVKVFETKDINKGWNGRYNDIPQPLGVYVYVIEGKINTGEVVKLTGNLTLVR